MALQLRESMSSKFKAVTLFVAMLALVVQPMYGFVAGQVANALQPTSAPVAVLKTESGQTLTSGTVTNEKKFTANLSASNVTDQSYFNMHLTVTGLGSSSVVYDNVTKLTADSNPKIGAGSFNSDVLTVLSDGNFNYPANNGQGVYTVEFQVCKTADDCSAFTQPVSITYDTSYVPTPPTPVCSYDFKAQKMWEITWGYDFAHRNGGTPKFTMQSNGGLTSLNGGAVPAYMGASWHWLYITEGQTTRHYDYGFADGTVRTADITFSNINGCQVPEITWGVNTSSTTFVNDPKYVRENNATDLTAQLVTPDSTTDVRFFVDGNVSAPIMGSNVGGAGATTSWWRLYAPLTAGKHTISAQVEVSGQWYPVGDTGIVYSLDTPTATYVSPNDTSFTFRHSDNPIRVKAEDQFNQFKSMDVKIGATTYTVLREDCDLRAAGNYVLCDVNASSTWSSLAEGTYTAVTSVKTQANNRLDGLTSRQFTVDGTAPQMMNARIVSPTNTPVYRDSIVLAQYVKESNQLNGVKFYVTKQRTDGQCDPNSPKVLATQSAHFVNHNPTNDTWYYSTTVDTSSLNGTNCIFSVAEDVALNHSDPQVKKISADFDNTAPSVPTAVLKDANDKIITNGYINTENFKFNLSTPATDNSIKYQVKYWNNIAGDQFQGESKAWTTSADASGVYADHFTRGEGTHYFAFSACDAVGNCSAYSTPFEVVYDNTAPTKPTITSPGDRTWHKTSPIATTWTAATDTNGIKNYQVAYSYDDGHGFAGSTCPGVVIEEGKNVYCRDETAAHRNHTPGSGEQGGVTVWVRAIDVAGNEGVWSKSVHYYYDHTNPTTTLVVPTGIVGKNFTVSGVADDNLALNRVYIQLNKREGGRFGGTTINLITNPFSTTNDWSKTFDANALGLTDGDYRATASVTDMAGNTTQLDWSDFFTVDTKAPEGNFTYSNNKAPTKGSVYAYLETTEPVTISPTGSHGWVEIDSTHFKHKFTNNGSFDAVITDEAGNSSTLTANVNWIDKKAPVGSGVADGQTVAGSVHLTVADMKSPGQGDSSSDVVSVSVDGSPVTTTLGANKTYLYDVTAEGPHTVVATDKAGNVSAVLHFTIDNTAPVVELTGYGDNMKQIQLGVTIDGATVTDGSGYTFSWSPASNTDVSFNPNVLNPVFTILKDGTYSYILTVTDGAGNTSTKAFGFTYTTPAPDADGDGTDNNNDGSSTNDGDNGNAVAAGFTAVTTGGTGANVVTLANNGTGVATPEVKSSETDKSNSEKKDVKGLETTADAVTSAGNKDGWNIFGFAWYWWLVLLAVIASFWWIIAAKKRRAEDQA